MKFSNKLENIFKKYGNVVILLGTSSLLLLQICICYNIFFITDWDVQYILDNAFKIANGFYNEIDNNYYSIYPNNILITWFFSLIFKFSFSIGITDLKSCFMIIIIVQCFLSSVSAYILYKVCIDFTTSYLFSCITWFLYCFFIGISPWIVIPYSDSIGLIFPILILRLYQQYKKSDGVGYLFCLGLFSYISFKIKPQLFIIVIAIIIVEFINFELKGWKNRIYKGYLSFVAAIMLGAILYSCVIIPATNIEINDEATFGTMHFLMMGLNPETGGAWNADDVAYSGSFSTSLDRKAGNIEIIEHRLADYGLSGLLNHTIKKCLMNYADGTFGWGMEGIFYAQLFENENDTLSPFLKNIFYSTGDYYVYYKNIKQTIWVTILLVSIGVAFVHINISQEKSEFLVAILAILGLTFFELLFEPRARYLYTYGSIYVFLGMTGWKTIITFLDNKFSWNLKHQ